jgi:uncharacterized protein YjlB
VEFAVLGERAPGGPGLDADTRTDSGPDFHILAGYEGSTLYGAPGDEDLEIRRGDFVLVPAALGAYRLNALDDRASVLRFRIGD